MYSTNEFRKGLKIEVEGIPYILLDVQFVKPGKGNTFVRTKLKNLLSGNNWEKTFKSGEKVSVPDLEEKKMQYLYNNGQFVFMDLETYEQVSLSEENLGDAPKYLLENTDVTVLFFQNEAISIDVPNFMNFVIEETDPGLKGDTVTGGTKPATLITGAIVQVPLFVNAGESIRVDTRNGTYVERVKN